MKKFNFEILNNVMEFVEVPAGKFLMGSLNGLPLEQPVKEVSFKTPFYMAAVPVTQSLWTAVMNTQPSRFSYSDELPVENVSWNDAVIFCERLSSLVGKKMRLPSEAEWEYACRAGTTSEFFFGESVVSLRDYAWFDMNSNDQTHPVGLKQPNPWGLYDMVGNVWEWCADVWRSDYVSLPANGSPMLAEDGLRTRRVLRGGAWDMDSYRCRSAYRSYEGCDIATAKFGFRIVCESI